MDTQMSELSAVEPTFAGAATLQHQLIRDIKELPFKDDGDYSGIHRTLDDIEQRVGPYVHNVNEEVAGRAVRVVSHAMDLRDILNEAGLVPPGGGAGKTGGTPPERPSGGMPPPRPPQTPPSKPPVSSSHGRLVEVKEYRQSISDAQLDAGRARQQARGKGQLVSTGLKETGDEARLRRALAGGPKYRPDSSGTGNIMDSNRG